VAEEPDSAAVEEEGEAEESLTDLLARLGRDGAALAFYESRLTARRHEQEIRRTVRDVVTAAVALTAFLAAFVLVNAAAVLALATALDPWLAALVLAAAWALLGVVLALVLLARARRAAKGDPRTLEEAREQAEQAVRATLERLSVALTKEIAIAAVPMAGGVVDAGEDLLETADDIVDAATDDLPAGGVVNQVWDVVLAPSRFGIRVATTVLKRGDSSS
jgi:Putative Actinobacterial Holin-X, holin superfamily III